MPRTRDASTAQTVRDGADDISIRFYIDQGAGRAPRCEVRLPQDNGEQVWIDRPLSDFSNLTAPQKVTLRSLLTTIRDQALTLEGFS